jgi:hypothetical protein
MIGMPIALLLLCLTKLNKTTIFVALVLNSIGSLNPPWSGPPCAMGRVYKTFASLLAAKVLYPPPLFDLIERE